MSELMVEVLDFDWNRKAITSRVIDAEITDELGSIGEARVTLPIDDQCIPFLPDPDEEKDLEARFRLYEDGNIIFAGVVDETTTRINSDNTYSFGGKQRGIILGTKNVGNRQFKAVPLPKLMQEFLRDNVGKAPLASIKDKSSQHPLHPAVNAIIGDVFKGNYWSTSTFKTSPFASNHDITINLGRSTDITGVRVIPAWWIKKWQTFQVRTADAFAGPYTFRGSFNEEVPLNHQGVLFEFTATCKYVKVDITSSSDGWGRLAGVLVYQDVATIGDDTDFVVPWIENDDSGNVTTEAERFDENGAFNGDGLLGSSQITRLSSNTDPTASHRFRGTSTSAFFTQGDDGGDAIVAFTLDGVFQHNTVLSGNTYQVKAFEAVGLTNSEHVLHCEKVTGTPQLDYFTGLYETSYRAISDDDKTVIGYFGSWWDVSYKEFSNHVAHRSRVEDSLFYYRFTGDMIKIKGTKGPKYGKTEFFIDGVSQGEVDLYQPTNFFQQNLFVWSGSYGDHSIRGQVTHNKNALATDYRLDLDSIEGNFSHMIYEKSNYDNNLHLLSKLSEITNSFLRFNHDGSVDLLSNVIEWAGSIVREGENEGGTIINAEATNDYSGTASAVLALVTSPEGLPLKAFVVDRNAIHRMGLKIRKSEDGDSPDAYLLTRQAWQELQDFKVPQQRFSVEYLDEDVGEFEVGQSTILHSERLGLTSGEQFKIGRKKTTFDNENG